MRRRAPWDVNKTSIRFYACAIFYILEMQSFNSPMAKQWQAPCSMFADVTPRSSRVLLNGHLICGSVASLLWDFIKTEPAHVNLFKERKNMLIAQFWIFQKQRRYHMALLVCSHSYDNVSGYKIPFLAHHSSLSLNSENLCPCSDAVAMICEPLNSTELGRVAVLLFWVRK